MNATQCNHLNSIERLPYYTSMWNTIQVIHKYRKAFPIHYTWCTKLPCYPVPSCHAYDYNIIAIGEECSLKWMPMHLVKPSNQLFSKIQFEWISLLVHKARWAYFQIISPMNFTLLFFVYCGAVFSPVCKFVSSLGHPFDFFVIVTRDSLYMSWAF